MGRPRDPWRTYATGSEISHFADFCREYLVHSEDRWEGQPVLLEPWQKRMLGEALAYDDDGHAVWRSVIIICSRKNGKTAILAALSIYRLVTSGGRPEILLAAPSDRVAGRLFDAAARFVRRSPELSKLLRIRDHAGEIVREDGMGVIYRLSSDPNRLYGYNPTHVVCDELASWVTPQLRRSYAALTSGGGARSAPQVFTITTAGEAQHRHSSILGRLLDAAAEAEDQERTPGLLVSRMWPAHTLLWGYEAPTLNPFDVEAMKLANPASWITKDYLRRQALDPELTDAQVLQLHGCVWAASDTNWLTPDGWTGAKDTERSLTPGEPIVLGFDGSYKRDATALVGCTLDGFIAPIAIWERPDGAGPDWKIPRAEVDEMVQWAMETYDVVELAPDPPGWASEIEGWQEMFGDVVVTFPTNDRKRMAAACDKFRSGILDKTLTHNNNQVLARHVGNAQAKETPYGIVIQKDHPDSPRKIDAAVAAVVAYDRAMWHASNSSPSVPMVAWV